jgi:hypothetical protein
MKSKTTVTTTTSRKYNKDGYLRKETVVTVTETDDGTEVVVRED